MAKINIVWKSWREDTPNRGFWDQAMLEDIFARELWKPVRGYEFIHHDGMNSLPASKIALTKGEEDGWKREGAIVIIPARSHAEKIEEINKDINRLDWCLIMLVGDEEAVFPCEELKHPNMAIYVMTPHIGKHKNADRFIVNGWSPGTREHLKACKERAMKRCLDWFFAGQVTHSRRQKSVKAMRRMDRGMLIETPGFTQGVSLEEFHGYMADAKVAPCPSGAVIPDSFRMYEALEAGCLPIADGKAPQLKVKGYWNFLFGEENLPFPVITDWRTLKGTVQYHVDTYPLMANRAFAWWQKYKRKFIYNIEDDIHRLSKIEGDAKNVNDKITVLVPTSPTRFHPSTEMIEETIGSIRERLPTAEVIIMFDGVREEQAERMSTYQEYIRRILWKCNFEWKNVLPLVFDSHHHQVRMTREALKLVRTPTILFVEHDAPLCEEIPFDNLVDAVISGDADMIRLNHEALILEEHRYMLLDKEPQISHGIPMQRTSQWSQRPHVASTEFYIRILNTCFSPGATCMIEDGIHGKVAEAYRTRGHVGWNDYKVWIYAPEGDMKRSYHLNGKMDDPKYEDTFIY